MKNLILITLLATATFAYDGIDVKNIPLECSDYEIQMAGDETDTMTHEMLIECINDNEDKFLDLRSDTPKD